MDFVHEKVFLNRGGYPRSATPRLFAAVLMINAVSESSYGIFSRASMFKNYVFSTVINF